MPRLDGTGPNGQGPMTGRRMGRCNTANTNINNNTAEQPNEPAGFYPGGGFCDGSRKRIGRGRGFGGGGGFGRGNRGPGRGNGFGQRNF